MFLNRNFTSIRLIRTRAVALAWVAVWGVSGLFSLSTDAAAATCRAESGGRLNTLVELYTSEGCSSCPPADRWLSGLRDKPGTVALAFHVDYWDRLGWRDRFASPGFTQRQRQKADQAGASFVYTPQVMVDGRDFRGWSSHPGGAGLASGGSPQAHIQLATDTGDGKAVVVDLSAQVTGGAQAKEALVWLALYENGLSSQVGAGENSGELLAHDFVVREWIGPLRFAADGQLKFSRQLLRGEVQLARAGVAAVVENSRDGTVLQVQRLSLACP